MAEADLNGPIIPHVPIPTRGRPLWVQGMACVAILPLLGFIGQSGRQLWGEVRSLQHEQVRVRANQLVGYVDINPNPNFAKSPDDWLHDEAGSTRLWATWKDGRHQWYTLGLGEIDPQRISTPLGQDVIRAVDFPLYEEANGARWARVADEARVAGFELDGAAFAYPLTILDKVEMVNDWLGDRPILVAYTPLTDATSVYESLLDGHRITLGHSGYFFGNHPILYDRGTESLWTEQGDAMVAVAGKKKGSSLKLVARLEVVPWSTWKADHSGGKLLIGADRSKPRPEE